jgi:hypothetical protein
MADRAGIGPLEWILLSNVAVPTVEEAWQRVDWYKCRWIIEEYHKGMKTGCAVEELPFTRAERLQPVIALLSVVTLLLLDLRRASRAPDAQTRPASTWGCCAAGAGSSRRPGP